MYSIAYLASKYAIDSSTKLKLLFSNNPNKSKESLIRIFLSIDLSLFFEGIYCYAKENRIYSKDGRLGEYFQIRIGDIGFEIGYRSGQGTDFYCKRVSPEDNFIDFLDILFGNLDSQKY